MRKTYRYLSDLKTFEERYEYLKTNSSVGSSTFGSKRYLNQLLYKDPRWKKVRAEVIIRDNGNDLGIEGREIQGPVYVHHINPITIEELLEDSPSVLDKNNLICCSYNTHEAIHYSNSDILVKDPIERKSGDTCPWKE